MVGQIVQQQSLDLYFQRHHLLFQFILLEFLLIKHESQQINDISRLLKNQTTENTNNHTYKEKLIEIFIKLTGKPQNDDLNFPWTKKGGSLSKLHSYCSLITLSLDNKEFASIIKHVDKSWKVCRTVLSHLETRQNFLEENQLSNRLTKQIEEIAHSLQLICRLIIKTIHRFHCDENVIFFLLRYKTAFDKLNGKSFLPNLFKKMYPKGIKEGWLLLQKKYSTRGFDYLLPDIAKLVEEIASL